MTFFRITLFTALITLPTASYPCTTLLVPGNSNVVVGKNMDWTDGRGLAFVNKRHVKKRAAFINPPQRPLTWTSQYMSLTFSQLGREFPFEGMNEAGLAVNIMVLSENDPPPMNGSKPGVNGIQWVQYMLDTAGTLQEAIQNAQAITLTGPFARAEHYFVCDANAKCASFEYSNGALVIHSGSSLPYTALTNNTYAESLAYLQTLLTTSQPKDILNRSGSKSLDRFARAALLSNLYSPELDPIPYAFSALDNVRQPKLTQWSLVFDLTDRHVHFRTAASPNVKHVNLSQFDPSCSSPVKTLRINELIEKDVTPLFSDYTSQENRRLISTRGKLKPKMKKLMARYPETMTQCMETP